VSHVRVGNRKPIGWVPIKDVLRWNTRLVIQAPEGQLRLSETPDGIAKMVEVGRASLPVLGWTEKVVELAVWDSSGPWSKVARSGWVRRSELPADAWGIWISQVELPVLLGLANQGESPEVARLRAILGRLADHRPLSSIDLEAIRKALPTNVLRSGSTGSAGRLAEANAQPVSEAGWAGLTFRFLPLSDLP
jgi:hypothetical protein